MAVVTACFLGEIPGGVSVIVTTRMFGCFAAASRSICGVASAERSSAIATSYRPTGMSCDSRESRQAGRFSASLRAETIIENVLPGPPGASARPPFAEPFCGSLYRPPRRKRITAAKAAVTVRISMACVLFACALSVRY